MFSSFKNLNLKFLLIYFNLLTPKPFTHDKYAKQGITEPQFQTSPLKAFSIKNVRKMVVFLFKNYPFIYTYQASLPFCNIFT